MSDEELRKLLAEIKSEASYKGNLITWFLLFVAISALGKLLEHFGLLK